MSFDRPYLSLRFMPFLREAMAAVLCAFLLLPPHSDAYLSSDTQMPFWWLKHGVVDSERSSDDFAVINQGQLKNLLKAAVTEMNAKLDDGAGPALNSMITGWNALTGAEDDYAAVNIGQLKTVAKPVHERLLAVGLIASLPAWAADLSPSNDDFAVANIGQAKYLLNFDLDLDSDSDGLSDYRELVLGLDPHDEDTDGDGLPDGWEYYHGLDAQITTGNDGADGDPDNDGITNAQALAQNIDPFAARFWIEFRYVSASIGMTGQVVTNIDCSDSSLVPSEALDGKKPSEIQSIFAGIVSSLQSGDTGWLGTPDPYSYPPLSSWTLSGGKGPAYYSFEEQVSLEGSVSTWTQFRLRSNRPLTATDTPPVVKVFRYNVEGDPKMGPLAETFVAEESLVVGGAPTTLTVDWGVIVEEDENDNETIVEHSSAWKKAVILPAKFEKYQVAYGFDDQENPPRQSIPLKSTAQGSNYIRRVKFLTSADMSDKFDFEIEPSGQVLVTPEAPDGGTTVLLLEGNSLGEATLKAKLKAGGQTVQQMKLDVLPRFNKTLRIDSVTATTSPTLNPVNVPSIAEMNSMLAKTWELQANVHFDGTTEATYSLNYDANKDGHLTITRNNGRRTEEEELIVRLTNAGNIDHLAVFVRSFDDIEVLGRSLEKHLFIATTDTSADKALTTAHEIGHMILRMAAPLDHNSSSELNLMYPFSYDGIEIRSKEWKDLGLNNP